MVDTAGVHGTSSQAPPQGMPPTARHATRSARKATGSACNVVRPARQAKTPGRDIASAAIPRATLQAQAEKPRAQDS